MLCVSSHTSLDKVYKKKRKEDTFGIKTTLLLDLVRRVLETPLHLSMEVARVGSPGHIERCRSPHDHGEEVHNTCSDVY